MYIRWKTTLPIVLGAVLSLWMLGWASHVAAEDEFRWAVRTRKIQEQHRLPEITEWFRTTQGFYWVMPVAFGIWGIVLLWRATATAIAWYVSIVVVAGTFWLSFTLLALYVCNQVFYQPTL